jgi:hypothetical protein
MYLTNYGSSVVTVSGPSIAPPGMVLSAPDAAHRAISLPPGVEEPFVVAFRVVDCRRIPRTDWPIRLAVQSSRPGSSPEYVSLATSRPDSRPWQVAATAAYCGGDG